MRRVVLIVLFSVLASGTVLPARAGDPPPDPTYADVPLDHWAHDAVEAVSVDANWLPGSNELWHPGRALTRRAFARALARAFAPGVEPDPDVTFPDLPETDRWFKGANVVVSRGWLHTVADGAFAGAEPVTKRVVVRALVLALGAGAAARGLNRIAADDGYAFEVPSGFGYLVLGDQLHLFYNHPAGDEAGERYPWEAVSRADGAYALASAADAIGGWEMASLGAYETITLPTMSDARKQAVEWAFRYAGYPYVYAGEWHRATPDAYCCGAQIHGGFDCSGFTWWVLAAPTSGWDNTHLRPYEGWDLPERSSYEMARGAPVRLEMDQLRPLDAVFFDTDGAGTGWRGVDHAGVYLGNGWMIHSSGSRAGVTIDHISDGWWAGTFTWGRRVVPKSV
jgi:hypothetical protein